MEASEYSFNERKHTDLLKNISTSSSVPPTSSSLEEEKNEKLWEDSRKKEDEGAEDHADISSMTSSREILEPILNSPFSACMQENVLKILSQHIPELDKFKYTEHPLKMLASGEESTQKIENRTEECIVRIDAETNEDGDTKTSSEPSSDNNILIHMVKLLMDVHEKKVGQEETLNREKEEMRWKWRG